MKVEDWIEALALGVLVAALLFMTGMFLLVAWRAAGRGSVVLSWGSPLQFQGRVFRVFPLMEQRLSLRFPGGFDL